MKRFISWFKILNEESYQDNMEQFTLLIDDLLEGVYLFNFNENEVKDILRFSAIISPSYHKRFKEMNQIMKSIGTIDKLKHFSRNL